MKAKLQKLEMLRGFAAFYVFTTHFVPARMLTKESGLAFLFRFGQEAVMLFFLLSGFVVYYSTTKHGDTSFRPYFARRFRRIYPIFLLALVLSYGSAVLSAKPDMTDVPITQILGNIFMLQDFSIGKPGVWFSTLGGNTALWSLSYEWWFYMLFFPIYRFVPTHIQMHVVAGLSFLGLSLFWIYPNQPSLFLMYFILWWCGAELGRSYLERIPFTVTSQKWSIAYLTLFCALLAIPILLRVLRHESLSFGIHPVLEFRHFGACLLFLVAGHFWARSHWKGFESLFGIFALLAPISYSLYVFHIPLAITSSYLAAIGHPAVEIISYVAIAFGAAYLAEVPFQNWINRATVSWIQRTNSNALPTDSAATACAPPRSPTAQAAPGPPVAEL